MDRITVSDICRLAEINRATFYRHYENQYGILSELELDLLDRVPPPQEGQSPTEALSAALQGLWEKREEWSHLPVAADPGLWAKLHRFLWERLPQSTDENRHRFLLHGLSGLMLDWMGDGFREPMEQVTARALQYFKT